jgi:hypothetical protein
MAVKYIIRTGICSMRVPLYTSSENRFTQNWLTFSRITVDRKKRQVHRKKQAITSHVKFKNWITFHIKILTYRKHDVHDQANKILDHIIFKWNSLLGTTEVCMMVGDLSIISASESSFSVNILASKVNY